MRPSRSTIAIAIGFCLVLTGCHPSAGVHDLGDIQGKITPGMHEAKVVAVAGTPDNVDEHGDYRDLRYNGTKGYLTVTLQNDVVIDVARRD